MTTDQRIAQAEVLYHRAVFGGEKGATTDAERHLDEVEAELALTRGKVVHARFLTGRVEDARELGLFEQAARLYKQLGDTRGEGEAAFWIGTFHQVVRDSHELALPYFRLAFDLATASGDDLTLSYVLRHLGFADHMAGRLPEARAHFEESTRLRRALGFDAGVAANLLGMAYLADQEQRREDAAALLAEATDLARGAEAHGVLGWIAGAREELGLAEA
ncbi:tetratricopeptide repeat protein [Kitasatospora sp. NPDC002227]|uniref:tetratricopeptide repeat protein n=1 Tax=Kitasatospora sp. NPDC002227 TaxID=3154773 RepID=UPI00331EDE23